MEHLIPQEWFLQMHWLVLVVIAVLATGVLIKGADWIVEGASGLAFRLGMPKVIIGATIVSLGTTSPEAAVSVMAAWRGESGLALGNGVGSIIADTALIFGLGACLVKLPADKFVLTRQGWVQFGSAVLLAGLCYFAYFTYSADAGVAGDTAAAATASAGGPQLGRWVGVLFIILLVWYMWQSVRWARQHPFGEPFVIPEEVVQDAERTDVPAIVPEPAVKEAARPALWLAGVVIGGLAIVIVSSHVLIICVSIIAERLGVPRVVIAGTVVAFGTSLPELMVGITALRKGHAELLVGNVIGADILNVLFVIGASALAEPLALIEPGTKLPEVFLIVHLPTMLLVLIIFRLFIFKAVRQGHFSRWMGYPLVAIYIIYTIVQFAVSVGHPGQ